MGGEFDYFMMNIKKSPFMSSFVSRHNGMDDGKCFPAGGEEKQKRR